ncbi:MAG: hypothetical protein K6G94_06610 [Kiritimatiellae bacterium]|nr:hypothetical protein [Kiritimatiellia bacterium]
MEGENTKTEGLVETERRFREFVSNRCEGTYRALVEGFVFEAMGTRRTATFPLPEIAFEEPENGGTFKFGFAVVRDDAGNPFAVFLTSHDMNCGSYPCAMDIVASTVLTDQFMKATDIVGIALNPWDGGGACIPKALFLETVARLSSEMQTDDE